MRYLTLIFLFFVFSLSSQPRPLGEQYDSYVKAARKCMKKKDYDCAISNYRSAFQSTGGRGRQNDFYNTAAAFALSSQKDSAFRWLGIVIVRNKFRKPEQIRDDRKFSSLHSDPRWDSLMRITEKNKTDYETGLAQMKKQEKESKQKQKEISGSAAPVFVCTDINGNSYDSEKLKGKVVVLNFWATWCGPCKKELPELNKVREKFRDKDVVFISFCSDIDSVAIMKHTLQRLPLNYNVVIGEAARSVSKQYAVYAIPVNVVIDKQGKVAFFETGYAPGIPLEIESRIQTCLEE